MSREKIQNYILGSINMISKGNPAIELYTQEFSRMTNKEFDQFIDDLDSGKKHLVIIEPANAKEKITTKRNIEVAKKLGFNFHQRLWFEGPGMPKHLTPIEYLVMDLPVRRQSQLLTKKLSVQESTTAVDYLTGQPTGKSKSAKISYPELQVLSSAGLEKSAIELIKFRGGDRRGYLAFSTSLLREGSVSLKAIEAYAGGVESIKSLKVILTAMHIRNTL